MQMEIAFPGGKRVDAHLNGLTVTTDQDGSAPTPFLLFLASLGTCAGIYVLEFCRHRDLPAEGIRILQRVHGDRESGMLDTVEIDIRVPPDFPEKYHAALVRSADQCAVKKHLDHPPEIRVRTVVGS